MVWRQAHLTLLWRVKQDVASVARATDSLDLHAQSVNHMSAPPHLSSGINKSSREAESAPDWSWVRTPSEVSRTCFYFFFKRCSDKSVSSAPAVLLHLSDGDAAAGEHLRFQHCQLWIFVPLNAEMMMVPSWLCLLMGVTSIFSSEQTRWDGFQSHLNAIKSAKQQG